MKKIILIIVLLLVGAFAEDVKVEKEVTNDFVYQLPLKKYPKFLSEATLTNGKTIQFISVKAMMQVYFHQKYFIKHKMIDAEIKDIVVQDYLNGTKIDAKRARYVFGSKVVGPHGDDLIPLKDAFSVRLFNAQYGGTKTMMFDDITLGLIKYLDM